MKKIFLFTGLLTGIAFLSHAQVKLLEKVERRGGELLIPYEKYQLANGLTILIHEDHSDPIIHIDVTYHVGSSREELGKSGFAHFFEHMMFQGSGHVADEQHFRIVSEAGGLLNGNTNKDRTIYYETLPSNQLEVALWLESDRMAFFLDSVTSPKFEVQRATVKNERGQRTDNQPYGRVNEKVCQALYPYNHPYSWPTIGWMEDLDKANLDDLRQFFLRFYGPNNAVLTIAGDVNPAEALKLAEKYFGSIPRGPEVGMPEKKPVTIDKDRYISYEDNIRFPMLEMVFPTVPGHHPDEAALDVLADILGGKKNSILYNKIIKTQKGISTNAEHPAQELAGMFTCSVRTFPDKSLAEMEQLIRESLSDFEKRGVTEEDLARYKAGYEANLVSSLASLSGKVGMLAIYQTYAGNPNYITEDIARYSKVTQQDVMRVYNQYIKNKPAVILSVYPKGKPEAAAKPDNYTPDKGPARTASSAATLPYNRTADNFDRSRKPDAGPNPVVKVPDFWTDSFPNGLSMIGMQHSEIPMVLIQLSVEAGHRNEANDTSMAGIAQMMASLWNEALPADELEKLGSSISVASSEQYIAVTISSLLKNLQPTLELAKKCILKPAFSEKEFDRIKKQQSERIANQSTQPVVIADNVFRKLLYGNKHIYSIPAIGTKGTVHNISFEDVVSYYHRNISPGTSKLIIVGDVSHDQIIPALKFLRKWKPVPVSIPPLPGTPAIDSARIYLVDKENAPQSEIRVGYMAMPYDDAGDYYKATLMNYSLGGAFNSRINLNLRENKGYTYGAHSAFYGDKNAAPFIVSAGVRANATDSSVTEIMKEIINFREKGITPEELGFTKKSIGQADALKYETPAQKAGFLRRIILYHLTKDFVDRQQNVLQNITREEIDVVAKKNLPYEKMAIVVVGDKKRIKNGLLQTGYPLIELDMNGNVK